MVKFESDCLECGLPCKGRACPNYEVEVHYCDCCGKDLYLETIYDDGQEELCEDCLLNKYIVE